MRAPRDGTRAMRFTCGLGTFLALSLQAAMNREPTEPYRPPANPGRPIKRERVRLVVNGHGRELALDPRVTLLDALRKHLHLKGTKKGCDRGQCGACTMLVNGRRINSCLTLAVSHDYDSQKQFVADLRVAKRYVACAR